MGTARSRKKQPNPSLNDALADLATQLTGAGWRAKRKRDWTPEERSAYERWSEEEWATRDPNQPATVKVVMAAKAEAERENDYLPHAPEPRHVALKIDRPGAEPFRP